MPASRGFIALPLLLLFVPAQAVASPPGPDAPPGPASSSAIAGEQVIIHQFQPTSFKVALLGQLEGELARAAREILDGNATRAFALAGSALPTGLMSKVNSTLGSYCSARPCHDSKILPEDVTRFGTEATGDQYLFELLRRSGMVNLTVTASGRAHTVETRLGLGFDTAGGAVASILPVGVDYSLNLYFGDAPSERIELAARLAGPQPARRVEIALEVMPGYRLEFASGVADRRDKENDPLEGYVRTTGSLDDPGGGAVFVLESGGFPAYCYVLALGVAVICVAAMAFGWRRAKRQERWAARRRKREEGEAEPTGPGTPGALAPRPEAEKLARLRDQGLITEAEFEARVREVHSRDR
jgi:hypothetical protein